MDKETFRFLKHILKTCETKGLEAVNSMADRADRSKKELFERLAEGSLEHLIELRSQIMNDMFKLADKTDQEARDGKLGIDNNDMHHLSSFVANVQVLRECERLIQEKLFKSNKED